MTSPLCARAVGSLAPAFLAALLSVGGCSRPTGPTDAPPPAPSGTAKTVSVPGTCAPLSASFRATLAHASGACTSAADCACYNPVVDEAGCGGVTDKATAAKLGKIEADFLAAGCPWPHLCAAMACVPRCESGRCANGQPL